ncbi:MAG TPA: hypothetical protein VFH80_10220 [Solirubrobacteraceae bacterium]|nr:hypothetical protein [Solirubrobacteraceae bacterium]
MRRACLAVAAVLTLLAVAACGTPSKPQRFGSCGPILLAKHRYGCAPVTPSGPTVNYYVAQTAAGTGSGSGSCSNAAAVSTLSTSTEWTAGNVIGLCGTITSAINAEGSGTAGNPITVYWEPGATLSNANWGQGAAISTNSHTYLTFNGGSDGSIQATALGSGLADAGQHAQGIWATGCTGCTIENLTIFNLYQHTSSTDTAVDQSQDEGIVFSGSDVTIADNTIHDVGWALHGQSSNGDSGYYIHGNDIYNVDHGYAQTTGFAGGSVGPVYFYDNQVHDYAAWDTTTDAYHHDGLHCYTSDSGAGASHYTGFYIFDNVFYNSGQNITAQIFLEGGTGSSATPCADSTSPVWVFNNIANVTDVSNNGAFGLFSGQLNVYNNTLSGQDTTGGTVYVTNSDATAEKFENNVLTTGDQVMSAAPSYFASGQPDYNTYANGGSNGFVCSANFYTFSQFSSWQSCIGADSHSQAVASASLNADYSPQAGSPVLGAGANLTSVCGALPTSPVDADSALCTSYTGPAMGASAGSSTSGTSRPSTSAWNAGAY